MKKTNILGVIVLAIAVIFNYGCDFIGNVPESSGLGTQPANPDYPILADNATLIKAGDVISVNSLGALQGFSIHVKGETSLGGEVLYGDSLPHRTDSKTAPIVYMTQDISREALLKMYEVLGVDMTGVNDRTVVKLHSGEGTLSNNLKPDFIDLLVAKVHGTIADTNTIYGGSRGATEYHKRVMEEREYTELVGEERIDIMDEHGDYEILFSGEYLKEKNIVGQSFPTYNSYIVLSHFKGHGMGGFGGALKNMSIGFASQKGKRQIHTGGKNTTDNWGAITARDEATIGFSKTMAEAAMSVHNYVYTNGKKIIYINVMNNVTLYCDCYADPKENIMPHVGIFASLDPVALDQACIDFMYHAEETEKVKELNSTIEKLDSLAIFEQAEKYSNVSRNYQLATID